jgi:hypothetical protein
MTEMEKLGELLARKIQELELRIQALEALLGITPPPSQP